jgi:hypothetical protein
LIGEVEGGYKEMWEEKDGFLIQHRVNCSGNDDIWGALEGKWGTDKIRVYPSVGLQID